MKEIKVWDLAVRVFHWLLVVAFSLCAYSAFQDKVLTGYDTMHLNAGLAVLILTTSRFIWGFVGSTTARFVFFLKGPTAVFNYIKEIKDKKPYRYFGHNPLGGWFVVFFMVGLMVQAIMGLYSNDSILFEGPLAATISGHQSNLVTYYHKSLGLVLIALAIVHITVVLLYYFVKGVNLIKPMITGRNSVSDDFKKFVVLANFYNVVWFLIILVSVGAVVYWYVF